MLLTDNIIKILSLLTLLGHIGIVALIALFVYKKFVQKPIPFLKTFVEFIEKNALVFSLAVATLSATGSLFFSEFSGFEPCLLCWYQRIFMYPLVILFIIALIKKEKKHVYPYALPLVIIGLAIAVYHYIIQMAHAMNRVVEGIVPCSYGEVTCTDYYFLSHGYITMPMMSVTAFALILVFLLYGFYKK